MKISSSRIERTFTNLKMSVRRLIKKLINFIFCMHLQHRTSTCEREIRKSNMHAIILLPLIHRKLS